MRVIRELSEAEVIRRWIELYVAGKHAGYAKPDPEQLLGRDATWVEVEVPHDLYDADWNTEESIGLSGAQLKRAEGYAQQPGALPPGIAGYKGRRASRGLKKLFVTDGNHRAYAAFLRGAAGARFYVPRCEWEKFVAASQA